MSTATIRDDVGNRSLRLPSWAIPQLTLALAVGVEVSRRPDIFRSPQFFAEDGQFYALAHNAGAFAHWLMPSNGYLQLAARLVAASAQAIPLGWAPAFFVAAAALLNALPAAFVVSDRMRSALPSVWARVLLAALYVALPGANHATGVVVYSQWHLSLVALMILVADAPVSRLGHVLDAAVLLVSGLSGPYSILLAPIAVVNWWLRPSVRSGLLATLVLACGVGQAITMATIGLASRSTAPRGATPLLLLRVVGGRVFYGATVGHVLQGTTVPGWPRSFGNDRFIAAVGALGIAGLVAAFWTGTHALRMTLAYGAAIVAAVLFNASVAPDGPPQWVVLEHQDALSTYFVIPIVAFYAALVWAVTRPSLVVRAAGAVVLILAVVLGIRHDWREEPVANRDFAASVADYDAAQPGAIVTVTIPPAPWTIELTKPVQ